MAKLCERPGCSDPGAAEYGMVPEDLLFWIAPLSATPHDDQNVLCLRHADAMSVPRGWTLDDRREEVPRLFKPRPTAAAPPVPSRRRAPRVALNEGEQLQIDGTGEITRPNLDGVDFTASAGGVGGGGGEPDDYAPWRADFDSRDDLDGLLEVSSPLLARAFRGTDRPRT